MTTKQMEPDLQTQRNLEEPKRNGSRTKRIGPLAVAAAIIVGAVALVLATRGEDDTTTADEQRPPAAGGAPTSVPGPASGPFLVDIQTGEKTSLTGNLGGGQSYVPSPDGEKLVYGTCCSAVDRVTVVNIDGTDARTLESPEGLNYYGPRWSPDGTKLVYQERDGGGDTAVTGDVGNLFVEDLASGRRTQITDLELSRAWWWFLSPSFSPNGRNVIFHLPRSKSETTKWDVWSVAVTGGEPKLVLRDASFPMLGADLPNDVRIAFVSPQPNGFAGHRIMTARLLSPPELSDLHGTLVKANESIWWPTMSPNGDKIAYQAGGSIHVVHFWRGGGLAPAFSKVANGEAAEWLDNNTLIVAPG